MKTCPVCKTAVFEDMDTCFGCMHRFGPDEETAMGVDAKRGAINDGAPSENWVLRVELRDLSDVRSWAFELTR